MATSTSKVVDYGVQAGPCGYCGSKEESSISHGMVARTMTVQDYQDLIDLGWRRSGTYLYKPNMCKTCCPPYTIRMSATEFQPSKEQARLLKRLAQYLDGQGPGYRLQEINQPSAAKHPNVQPNLTPNATPHAGQPSAEVSAGPDTLQPLLSEHSSPAAAAATADKEQRVHRDHDSATATALQAVLQQALQASIALLQARGHLPQADYQPVSLSIVDSKKHSSSAAAAVSAGHQHIAAGAAPQLRYATPCCFALLAAARRVLGIARPGKQEMDAKQVKRLPRGGTAMVVAFAGEGRRGGTEEAQGIAAPGLDHVAELASLLAACMQEIVRGACQGASSHHDTIFHHQQPQQQQMHTGNTTQHTGALLLHSSSSISPAAAVQQPLEAAVQKVLDVVHSITCQPVACQCTSQQGAAAAGLQDIMRLLSTCAVQATGGYVNLTVQLPEVHMQTGGTLRQQHGVQDDMEWSDAGQLGLQPTGHLQPMEPQQLLQDVLTAPSAHQGQANAAPKQSSCHSPHVEQKTQHLEAAQQPEGHMHGALPQMSDACDARCSFSIPSPACRHKAGSQLTVSMAPSSFVEEEYQLYRRYQIHQHGDAPDDITREKYTNFLVDSPLQQVTASSTDALNLIQVSGHTARAAAAVAGHEPQGLSQPHQQEQLRQAASPPCGFGSFHMQYRIDGALVAVGVVDVLPRCLSGVYLFWDPAAKHLALGKLTALYELLWVAQQASQHVPSLRWYYMGYYIHNCHKMKYKGQYQPSDLLCPETKLWVRLTPEMRSCLDQGRCLCLASLPDVVISANPALTPEEAQAAQAAVQQGDSAAHGISTALQQQLADEAGMAGEQQVDTVPGIKQSMQNIVSDMKVFLWQKTMKWKAMKKLITEEGIVLVGKQMEAWLLQTGQTGTRMVYCLQ